jgi:iron(III) transport system permease protein
VTTDLSAAPKRSTTTAGRGNSPRPPFGVSAVSILAVLIALFSLVPLGYVAYMTVATGWDTAVALILRPRVAELLLNTVLLIATTIPLCLLLGVAGAWLVERTKLRGHRVWAVLLAAPLAVPAFVNSYAWVSAIPSLGGLGSGILISTLSYFPLVYIPTAATLSRLDPAIEQSAAALGLGAWRSFFRVVLPQLRIAMTGGALLVGLHLLAEYGAFAMIRFDTFTTAIMTQYKSTFNGAAGNMLASVLVFFCLLLLMAEVRSRGTARYARIGSGVQGRALRLPLHAYQLPAQLFLFVLAALAFGLRCTLCCAGRWPEAPRPGPRPSSFRPSSPRSDMALPAPWPPPRWRSLWRTWPCGAQAGSASPWSSPTTSRAPCPASWWRWRSSP